MYTKTTENAPQGYVRGVVMLCGFLMVPRPPEAGGGCTITMIVHTDLGGNLPAGILNHLSTSSPWRLVQKLRAVFKKGASTAAIAACQSPESGASAQVNTSAAASGSGSGFVGTAPSVPASTVSPSPSAAVAADGGGRGDEGTQRG